MKDSPVQVLIVGQGAMRGPLSELLGAEAMLVEEAEASTMVPTLVRRHAPDVLLLDTGLANTNVLEVLRRARELDRDLAVVLITAFADLREAVAAVKAGAYDYLCTPLNTGELVAVVRRACAQRRARRAVDEDAENNWSLPERMGESETVRRLAAEVARVAPTNFSVVITGETGVGKELVARAIHAQGHRARAQFLAVDCGAIPESLIENELFGHEKGAFTGADHTGFGKFEAASGGTLFLDEISNLPIGVQGTLLRVLAEKRFCRIGGSVGIKVDVRLIAATNQDLEALVQAKSFRGDLFHRLSEYVLHVPALRQRREDIVYLEQRFLHRANQELGKAVQGFSESAIQLMLNFDWPGNVRQLHNVIRGAVLLADEVIGPEQLRLGASRMPIPCGAASNSEGRLSLKEIVYHNTIQVERTILAQVLQQTGGNKAKAARMLGIDYKTIHTKIRQYGI